MDKVVYSFDIKNNLNPAQNSSTSLPLPPAEGRDFEYARKIWKPLFDKYGVDLVLNGHDHTYARGHIPIKSSNNG